MSEEFLREINEDDLNPKSKKKRPADGLFERTECECDTCECDRQTLQEG
jgi:hypothetical protein